MRVGGAGLMGRIHTDALDFEDEDDAGRADPDYPHDRDGSE